MFSSADIVTQLITQHGIKGILVIAIFCLWLVSRYSIKEFKKYGQETNDKYKELAEKHEKNYQVMVQQMIDINIRNTEANVRLNESIRDLSNRL